MKKNDDRSAATVVTTETVTGTIPAAAGLSMEEERVLRMRSGLAVALDAPLGSKLEGVAESAQADVAARLALIEANVLGLLDQDEDDPARAARKQRIVDALRDQEE